MCFRNDIYNFDLRKYSKPIEQKYVYPIYATTGVKNNGYPSILYKSIAEIFEFFGLACFWTCNKRE